MILNMFAFAKFGGRFIERAQHAQSSGTSPASGPLGSFTPLPIGDRVLQQLKDFCREFKAAQVPCLPSVGWELRNECSSNLGEERSECVAVLRETLSHAMQFSGDPNGVAALSSIADALIKVDKNSTWDGWRTFLQGASSAQVARPLLVALSGCERSFVNNPQTVEVVLDSFNRFPECGSEVRLIVGCQFTPNTRARFNDTVLEIYRRVGIEGGHGLPYSLSKEELRTVSPHLLESAVNRLERGINEERRGRGAGSSQSIGEIWHAIPKTIFENSVHSQQAARILPQLESLRDRVLTAPVEVDGVRESKSSRATRLKCASDLTRICKHIQILHNVDAIPQWGEIIDLWKRSDGSGQPKWEFHEGFFEDSLVAMGKKIASLQARDSVPALLKARDELLRAYLGTPNLALCSEWAERIDTLCHKIGRAFSGTVIRDISTVIRTSSTDGLVTWGERIEMMSSRQVRANRYAQVVMKEIQHRAPGIVCEALERDPGVVRRLYQRLIDERSDSGQMRSILGKVFDGCARVAGRFGSRAFVLNRLLAVLKGGGAPTAVKVLSIISQEFKAIHSAEKSTASGVQG